MVVYVNKYKYKLLKNVCDINNTHNNSKVKNKTV